MRDTLMTGLACVGAACLVCTTVVVLYVGSVALAPKYLEWRERLQRRLDAHLKAVEQRDEMWIAIEELIESTRYRRAGARGEMDG